MKTKDEVFKKFQEFKSPMEKQTDKNINVLRSYNGSKYTSKDFDAFCNDAMIKRELIVSYNHQ